MLHDMLSTIMLKLTGIGCGWPGKWAVELTGELVAFTLMLCFAGLANLEHRFPKIKRSAAQTRQSYRTNVSLFTFNSILMSVCSVSALFLLAERYARYGLLQAVPDPTLKFLLAFLAMDLLLYAWHRMCHSYDVLWLFHRVHHNDPWLNVSTAFRLHFLEILFTNCLKALLIVILGIDKIAVILIESIVTLCIMFHHSNISFRLERILGTYMIVPALHRLHHSTERREHDRNFGAVLTVWDKLFGTLLELEPKAIGIKGQSPQDFIGLVKFGFGFAPAPQGLPANLDQMIAEAAYYKAEKRNFYPGYDMRDWLEGKKDVLNQMSGKNNGWAYFQQQAMAVLLKKDLLDVNRAMQQAAKKHLPQLQWR